jgi:hypothetical protein
VALLLLSDAPSTSTKETPLIGTETATLAATVSASDSASAFSSSRLPLFVMVSLPSPPSRPTVTASAELLALLAASPFTSPVDAPFMVTLPESSTATASLFDFA